MDTVVSHVKTIFLLAVSFYSLLSAMHTIPFYYWKTKKHIAWEIKKLITLDGKSLYTQAICYNKDNDLMIASDSSVDGPTYLYFDQKTNCLTPSKHISSLTPICQDQKIDSKRSVDYTSKIWVRSRNQNVVNLEKYTDRNILGYPQYKLRLIQNITSTSELCYQNGDFFGDYDVWHTTSKVNYYLLTLNSITCDYLDFLKNYTIDRLFFSKDGSALFFIDNKTIYLLKLKTPSYIIFDHYDIKINYSNV